jgi:2,4-dienoyl-CoA reductase (NADPH2)
MACRIPGKGDFAGTIVYFEAELERLGVAIHLGSRIQHGGDLAGFDAVVVATGVTPRRVDLPGHDLPHVVSYADLLLDGAREPGERVAIVGAGGIGVDVAHLLSHPVDSDERASFYARYRLAPPDAKTHGPQANIPTGRYVTLMRRGTRIGEHVGPSTRWAVVQELRMAGVEILTGIAYDRIEPGAVLIRDGAGAPRRVDADTVVIAAGQEPENALARELERAGKPHVTIGGAVGATELDAERAFREGAQAPAAIARLLG